MSLKLTSILTLSATMIFAMALAAGSGSQYHELDVSVHIDPLPDSGGRVGITVSVTTEEVEWDFRIRIEKTIGLHYTGVRDTIVSGRWRDTCQFRFTVDVPDETLSGIALSVETGNRTLFFVRSFDLTGDTASVSRPPLQRLISRTEIARLLRRPRSIRVWGQQEVLWSRVLPSRSDAAWKSEFPPGYEDAPLVRDLRNSSGLIDFDEVRTDPVLSNQMLLLKDKAVVARMPRNEYLKYHVPQFPPQTDREEMSQLERFPLDYAEEEWIVVDDTVFGRAYGQKRFQVKAFYSEGKATEK